jgi:poly(A) polymerase
MFYDPLEDKIIDLSATERSEAKLIRFIGDPHERILEDHLRILRAVRFKISSASSMMKTYTVLLAPCH